MNQFHLWLVWAFGTGLTYMWIVYGNREGLKGINIPFVLIMTIPFAAGWFLYWPAFLIWRFSPFFRKSA